MELKDFREEIDKIDDAILNLFIQRMEIAARIGVYKKEHGLPALDAIREHEKLLRISENSPEDLKEYSAALFSSIMEISRGYQNKILCSEDET